MNPLHEKCFSVILIIFDLYINNSRVNNILVQSIPWIFQMHGYFKFIALKGPYILH